MEHPQDNFFFFGLEIKLPKEELRSRMRYKLVSQILRCFVEQLNQDISFSNLNNPCVNSIKQLLPGDKSDNTGDPNSNLLYEYFPSEQVGRTHIVDRTIFTDRQVKDALKVNSYSMAPQAMSYRCYPLYHLPWIQQSYLPHLIDDEVIEGVVVRYNEILFNVHEVVGGGGTQFVELFAQLLQGALKELVDAVACNMRRQTRG